MPDTLADILVERDGIAKIPAAGMRRGGKETIIRRVAAIHIRMGDPAEDGELVAVFFENFEVWGKRIIAPGLLRKKLVRKQAEIVADCEHAARLVAGTGGESFSSSRYGGEGRTHRIQERQGESNACTLKKAAARQRVLR
jgi:hypothetical protein